MSRKQIIWLFGFVGAAIVGGYIGGLALNRGEVANLAIDTIERSRGASAVINPTVVRLRIVKERDVVVRYYGISFMDKHGGRHNVDVKCLKLGGGVKCFEV